MYSQTLEPIASGKWLEFLRAHYVDKSGHEYGWEMIRRIGCNDSVQCVDVIPMLMKKDQKPSLILVKQYRAPCNCMTIEFPAGLVGKNEEPEECAIRELWEETGYVAYFPKKNETDKEHSLQQTSCKDETHQLSSSSTPSSDTHEAPFLKLCSLSPAIAANPAVAPTLIMDVKLFIDGDSTENAHPKTHCMVEEGESTEVILLPLDSCAIQDLNKIAETQNCKVEGKVYSFVEGYCAAMQMQQLLKASEEIA